MSMKFTIFSLFILLTLFIACDTSGSTTEPPKEGPMEDLVRIKDTISVQKFNKWRNAWEKNAGGFADTSAQFKYFTLPVVDLKEVLAENASGTKFYFGLEKIEKEKFYLKFMLVGTDKNNNDLIDAANSNYIYDMSKTCPPFCNGD